jgi:hypothetical protein
VIRAAASDHPGTAPLWLPSDDAGDRGVSSLVPRGDVHARAVKVACVALDGLGLHDVGFMKIDTDGNELPVLRGAKDILTRDRPALFVELESRIQPITPVVDHLADLGYAGWILPSRTWLPLDAALLEAHQAMASYVVTQGLLRRVLPFGVLRGPRYVNSVLFLPDGRRPGDRRPEGQTTGARPDVVPVRDDGRHAARESTEPSEPSEPSERSDPRSYDRRPYDSSSPYGPLHAARLPTRPAAPHGRPQSGPGRGRPA